MIDVLDWRLQGAAVHHGTAPAGVVVPTWRESQLELVMHGETDDSLVFDLPL